MVRVLLLRRQGWTGQDIIALCSEVMATIDTPRAALAAIAGAVAGAVDLSEPPRWGAS
jgi:hypothetical protein